MKLRLEKSKSKSRISDEYGKKYYLDDETDMEVLCQDVNELVALCNFKIRSLESKLEAITDILGDRV